MRLSSVLFVASTLTALGTPACGSVIRRGAAPDDALSPSGSGAPPEDAQDGAAREEATEQPEDSASSSADAPAPDPQKQPGEDTISAQVEVRRRALQAMITGVALTAVGGMGAATGGYLLGRGAGVCRQNDEGCAAGVALPVTGGVLLAASVLPLVLGVSLWIPKVPVDAPGSPGAAPGSASSAARREPFLQPTLYLGPAAAVVRFRF